MTDFPKNIRNSSYPTFLAGLIGGLAAGVSLVKGGLLLLGPALALLWSVNQFPSVAFLWGSFAVLISHRWLLALHPLTWLGIPSFLSFPISIIIWLICGFLGGSFVSLWAFIGKKLCQFAGSDKDLQTKISYALVLSLI